MVKKTSLLLISINLFIYSQEFKIDKAEPPNWWVGMKHDTLQIMFYGEGIQEAEISLDDEKVYISRKYDTSGSNYLFADIIIPPDAKPGDYIFIFTINEQTFEYSYPILERIKDEKRHMGFNSGDIIYLLMPDRFANGDQSNDIVKGYPDEPDRLRGSARHGGDLQGIIDHLDYIKEAGFTAIWLNPVVENNTEVSYHGYAATDFYTVDPRLGSNELYKKLVEEAHKKELKIILDHVANHIHINHPWMKDLPMEDWINGAGSEFAVTNHDKIAFADIHRDSAVIEQNTRGWFTRYMPDLNQENPFLANYIIQNTIWWMEYAGIDGIREDTYPYADPEFMSEWAQAIFKEYPGINIVGEVWKGDPVILAAYQQNNLFINNLNSYLPCVTDFALSDVLKEYLRGEAGIQKIYEVIGMDFVYPDPENLLTFIDNHDVERALYTAKENINKFKLALQILLTTRGIPQLLYATEIGAVGGADHGSLRTDFPGGFPGDPRNAFTDEGRTEKENDIFNFVKQIIKIRKNNRELSEGKLIHFPPNDNIYVYFRILGNEKIMIVVNNNEDDRKVSLEFFSHLLEGAEKIKELKSGDESDPESSVTVEPYGVNIYKIL